MCENTKKNYLKDLLNIAFPIILGNISFILIGIGDIIVAGRHSTQTFAAISIANAFINCIMTLAIGLIAGISPLLSNYRGEGKIIKRYFYPSIRFSMFLAFLMMVFILLVVPIIPYMGYEQNLSKDIQQYMIISAFSTFGGCLHMCLKEFLQAYEIVLFPNLLALFSIFLNLLLNIVFVFGFGFIKPMGAVGLAVATFFVRYFMGFALLVFCFVNMNFKNFSEKDYYKKLIKIGLPLSVAILIEFFAFNSISIVMGRVAGVYAATQNLMCSLTTISFMVPLAISNAIAVKVGFSNGARNYEDVKNYSLYGSFSSVAFMFCSAVLFLSFPNEIISVFTKDEKIYELALPIMLFLGCFQIFDGLQISLQGICKGLKNTSILTFANFFAYWIISRAKIKNVFKRLLDWFTLRSCCSLYYSYFFSL